MVETSRVKNLSEIIEIINEIKTSSQYEHVFHLIVERLRGIFNSQTCAIVLIDPKTEYLRIENSTGLSLTFCKGFRKVMATGEIGKLLWTGIPILITDSEIDYEQADQVGLEKTFGSCIAVQISVNQRPMGYLYIDSIDKNHFSDQDVPVVQMFADIAGLALHKYKVTEQIRRLERTDQLTGLETYNSFFDKLNQNYDRAKTFGERFAVIIFDIDNFKTIVNTFGTEIGNSLLKEISEVIQSRIRPVDFACRYGVDEFIILVTKTGIEEAVLFAENLRKFIDENVFTEKKIDSSISVGLSVYPINGTNIEELMLTGKHAMFEAQRAGRNKVMYYMSGWYMGEPILFQ